MEELIDTIIALVYDEKDSQGWISESELKKEIGYLIEQHTKRKINSVLDDVMVSDHNYGHCYNEALGRKRCDKMCGDESLCGN